MAKQKWSHDEFMAMLDRELAQEVGGPRFDQQQQRGWTEVETPDGLVVDRIEWGFGLGKSQKSKNDKRKLTRGQRIALADRGELGRYAQRPQGYLPSA